MPTDKIDKGHKNTTVLSYTELNHLNVNVDHYEKEQFLNFLTFFLIRPKGRGVPKNLC